MSSRAPLVALIAAGCATARTPPPEPHSFRDVRSVALVRWMDDPGAGHGKDPLDALRESLVERGYDARLVEIGRGRNAAREVERFYFEVDRRIAATAAPDRPGPRAARVSPADAAAALAALGADAMAVYHRLAGQPMLLPPAAPDPFDPFASPRSREAVPYVPLGALSIVDRDGNLAWIDWGTPPPADAEAPANAVEAVDALLAVLAGQGADAP